MSSSLESRVLLALWQMYQHNQISLEQKGWIKDLLIRRDYNFYSAIVCQQSQEQIEEKIMDILNYQGSPRDLDAEETICPIIRLSNPSTTPTTTKSYQLQLPAKRFRFMSSSNEAELMQNNQRVRSSSFHHQ